MSSIYQQGRRKEYKLCEDLKKNGFDIVFRSAGSHSPIDIVAINQLTKVIKFVQSKRTISKTMNEVDLKLKKKIEREYQSLNNVFRCEFEVM